MSTCDIAADWKIASICTVSSNYETNDVHRQRPDRSHTTRPRQNP